jgi:uncharacterized phiE125 gp8 family phage protein
LTHQGLVLTSAPSAEPVTLAEAKDWLRVDGDADDALIEGLISVARSLAERFFDRSLVTQAWTAYYDRFDCWEIRLPRGPLQAVNSVQYLDTAGDLQTLDAESYEADETRDPGTVQPAYAEVWPATRCAPKAVRVTFTSGYGSAAEVPEPVKAALKFAVSMWYRRRGDGAEEIDPGKLALPQASQMMLMAYWPGSYP